MVQVVGLIKLSPTNEYCFKRYKLMMHIIDSNVSSTEPSSVHLCQQGQPTAALVQQWSDPTLQH